MFNRKILAKSIFSIALAAVLTFSGTASAFPTQISVKAEAKQNVSDKGIVDVKRTRIEDLGFASYLAIVLGSDVDYSKCTFKVDGVQIHPTKVSDTGSVLKWEIVHFNHKELTVEYDGETQKVLLNNAASGASFVEDANKQTPKWIWSYGPLSVFDYHLPSYDNSGQQLLHPKQTFDVLNSNEQPSAVAYYAVPAVMEKDEVAPEVVIKFALKSDKDKEWFNSIKSVKRMVAANASATSDEYLVYESKIIDTQYGPNGVITIKEKQQPLRRNGINYIRIASEYGTHIVEAEIINATELKLLLTGSITNPRVGEDVRFKVLNLNQGITLQKDLFKTIILERPKTDGSSERDKIDLKQSDLILISDLLNLNGKLLTKTGMYKLNLKANGYKEVSVYFEVLPQPGSGNANGGGSGNSNAGGSNGGSFSGGGGSFSGGGGGSNAGGSAGGGGGFSGSGGGSNAGGSGNLGAKESDKTDKQLTIADEKTPLKGISIDKTKVAVVKVENEKKMRSAIIKDIKNVFGAAEGLTLREVLVYLYKADSAENQKKAKSLNADKLTKEAREFALKNKIVSKKQVKKAALKQVLTGVQVKELVDKYIKQKLIKAAYGKKKTVIKLNALTGATNKIIKIGKSGAGSSGSSSSGATKMVTSDFAFDYEMIINAKLLKNIDVTNADIDRLVNMFDTGVTNHKAIFNNSNELIKFDEFRTAVVAHKAEGKGYLSFADFAKTLNDADYLKGRPHQVLMVLNNGSIGKHYFGFSANPGTFGPKLPDISKNIELNKGQDLKIDLKDYKYVRGMLGGPYEFYDESGNVILKMGIEKWAILFNTESGVSTDLNGVVINDTVLTVSADKISKELKGKDSMYITLVSKGYERLRVDIKVKSDEAANPGTQEPNDPPQNQEPNNPSQPEGKKAELTYDLKKDFYGIHQLKMFSDKINAEDYVKAITGVTVDGVDYTLAGNAYNVQNREFYNKSYMGSNNLLQIKFSTDKMSYDGDVKIVIKATGYSDLTLTINPKQLTVKEVTAPTGGGTGTPGTQEPADPPQNQQPSDPPQNQEPSNPSQPEGENLKFTYELSKDPWQIHRLKMNSDKINADDYVQAITAVTVDGAEYKLAGNAYNVQNREFYNKSYMGSNNLLQIKFSTDKMSYDGDVTIVIKATGYADLTLTINPKKCTVK